MLDLRILTSPSSELAITSSNEERLLPTWVQAHQVEAAKKTNALVWNPDIAGPCHGSTIRSWISWPTREKLYRHVHASLPPEYKPDIQAMSNSDYLE